MKGRKEGGFSKSLKFHMRHGGRGGGAPRQKVSLQLD